MVTMSQKEFQRVKVIENAAGGRLSVREASRLLQLSERQVQRLKRRFRPHSVGWVQHGNRGRSMPWAVSAPQKQLILNLARLCPAFADTPEKPSNSPINWMAPCASIAETVSSSRCLCHSKNTPNPALRPSPPRRKEKPRCPADTTFPAAPL
jgi:hypothetical protein